MLKENCERCGAWKGKVVEERSYAVRAMWDDEASVWVATSADVPGLVAEAPDLESLIEKLRILIPELLEANGALPPHFDHQIDLPIKLLAEYREHIRIQA